MAMTRQRVKQEVVSLLLVLSLVTVARSSLADHYYVPSGSMEETLLPGDRVVVDKTAYGVRIPLTTIDIFGARGPDRGDVVVFDSPTDGIRLIKRVVAVGGDIVDLDAGHLTINGMPLAGQAGPSEDVENFGSHTALLNLDAGGGPPLHHFEVPAGQVLVLGDHRGNSHDGRYFGTIDETELYGRAIAVYYRRGEGDRKSVV